MKQNGRFMVGLVGVAAVVTYLVWTGVSDTMVYYLTPAELIQKIDDDPTFRDVGVKVSGRLVVDSHEQTPGTIEHHFVVHDLEDESITFPVVYRNPLPDTFTDSPEMVVDVVLEGRFNEAGVFEATTVLTKCGSRYEASPEELRT
jgi:cytochrome c-type biogenesis protein CcmE